ncbi:MAG TPA: pyruvate kinase, partial [Gemmatimonadales bacterium]|nr:pyruvate kinase [Gemmatimonadales bacterium]
EATELLAEVAAIRAEIVGFAADALETPGAIHPSFLPSAHNLLHYLELRQRDRRPLQQRLAELGLSSLGRAESRVLATLDAVIRALAELAQAPMPPLEEEDHPLDFAEGQALLAGHTTDLLGESRPDRPVRIIVTMPTEAAGDPGLVHRLLEAGMDCLRINCAHDDAEAWGAMIRHLRRAEQALGRSCRVAMDLAGPKLRTGPVEPGPEVVKVRPHRDPLGRVVQPARVWLTADPDRFPPPTPADAVLPIDPRLLRESDLGEDLRFVDSREARRRLTIVDITRDGVWAEANRTAYLVPGMKLVVDRQRSLRVGAIPPRETVLRLALGDSLVLTRDEAPGRPATRDSQGQLLTPATIGCTLPEVFEDVEIGQRILFDDGRIAGVIEAVLADRVRVRITETRRGGDRLRADKGINLPDSRLRIRPLTDKDLEDLPFIAEHADLVALSFASEAGDLRALRQRLAGLGARRPALVLKIETKRAFENLPGLLLAAMEEPTTGVMIARGDLAVESGFERLAELQEEILWICEAAHVPVIWATQVLETLAKTGMPSRAEITDAAMAHRAECVMLNKGPEIVAAVEALDDILRRMGAHQAKKSPLLRELRLASAFKGRPD